MNIQLSQEERDRIARQYECTVPPGVTVTKYRTGQSAIDISYTYVEGKGLVSDGDYKARHKKSLEVSWSAAKRKNIAIRIKRRREVAELHALGYLNYAIANQLGLSPCTVGEDLKALNLLPNKKPSEALAREERHRAEMDALAERIAALAAEGKHSREIGDAINRTAQWVANVANRRGIALPKAPKVKKSRKGQTSEANAVRKAAAMERAQPALDLAAQGHSSTKIADMLGLSRHTVSKWIKRYGGAK